MSRGTNARIVVSGKAIMISAIVKSSPANQRAFANRASTCSNARVPRDSSPCKVAPLQFAWVGDRRTRRARERASRCVRRGPCPAGSDR